MKKLVVFFLIMLISLFAGGCSNNPIDEAQPYEPEEFNVGNLKVNSEFKVDFRKVSGNWSDGFDLMYWVPSASLGKPDTTIKELIEMKGQSEKIKEQIDNVFEVLAYVQAVGMDN
jgi:hypothetical protein